MSTPAPRSGSTTCTSTWSSRTSSRASVRGARRRRHRPARPERGREDDDAARHDGARAAPGLGAVAGAELSRPPTHAIVRRGIGYVPEDRDVFAGSTVSENLRLAERNGSPRYALVYELFPSPRARAPRRRARSPAGSSRWSRSPGAAERQPDPAVDEPTKGSRRCSSPRSPQRSSAAELATVVLVEQNLAVARRREAGRGRRRRPGRPHGSRRRAARRPRAGQGAARRPRGGY